MRWGKINGPGGCTLDRPQSSEEEIRHMPRLIRPIRVDGNIAYIPLTRNYEAIIDAADVPLVEGRNWAAKSAKQDNTFYAYNTGVGMLHRILLVPPADKVVDHIDGNGLNNRRSNLRLCAHHQNLANARVQKRSVSGYKGVTWYKPRQMWRARITLRYKTHFLGLFDTAEAAKEAYDTAAREYFGEYARLR